MFNDKNLDFLISKEPNKVLQSILNTVIDSVIIINDRGVIEYINSATGKLFQYSKQEVIGKKIR